MAVEIVEGFAELDGVVQAVLFHPLVLAVDEVAQADAFDELHDEVLLALGRHAVFESADDVGVLEPDGDDAFGGAIHADEAFFEAGGLGSVEDLEGDGLAGHGVAGPPDLGHAALADATDELEPLLDVDRFGLRRLGGEQFFEELHA